MVPLHARLQHEGLLGGVGFRFGTLFLRAESERLRCFGRCYREFTTLCSKLEDPGSWSKMLTLG